MATTDTINDKEDLIAQQRRDQAPHECEVLGSGPETEEIRTCWMECEKNPGHETFIPINDLKAKHLELPYGIRKDLRLEAIHHLAALTVRVRVNHVSEDRPERYNCAKKIKCTLLGTGWIFEIREGHGPCECKECQTSSKPADQWWKCLVFTACHVVFDASEAWWTSVDLFYDDDAAIREERLKTLYGVGMRIKDQEGDFSIMECAIHDASLVEKLKFHIESFLVKRDLIMATDRHNICIMVSHPHGKSKRVTIGKVVEGEATCGPEGSKRSKHMRTYTTDTCYGSSGAPVFCTMYGAGSDISLPTLVIGMFSNLSDRKLNLIDMNSLRYGLSTRSGATRSGNTSSPASPSSAVSSSTDAIPGANVKSNRIKDILTAIDVSPGVTVMNQIKDMLNAIGTEANDVNMNRVADVISKLGDSMNCVDDILDALSKRQDNVTVNFSAGVWAGLGPHSQGNVRGRLNQCGSGAHIMTKDSPHRRDFAQISTTSIPRLASRIMLEPPSGLALTLGLGLAVVFSFVLIIALGLEIPYMENFGLALGLVLGILFGLIIGNGLILGLGLGFSLGSRLRFGLKIGCGLVLGLGFGSDLTLLSALGLILVLGLGFMLNLGLRFIRELGLGLILGLGLLFCPREVFGFQLGLVIGLIIGLGCGLVIGHGRLLGLKEGFGRGLILGLAFGLDMLILQLLVVYGTGLFLQLGLSFSSGDGLNILPHFVRIVVGETSELGIMSGVALGLLLSLGLGRRFSFRLRWTRRWMQLQQLVKVVKKERLQKIILGCTVLGDFRLAYLVTHCVVLGMTVVLMFELMAHAWNWVLRHAARLAFMMP